MITKNALKPEEKAERLKLFEDAIKDGSFEKWIAKAKRIKEGYKWTIDTDGMETDIVHGLMLKIINGDIMNDWDFVEPNLDQVMYMDMRRDIFNLHKREARKVRNGGNDKNGNEENGGFMIEDVCGVSNEETNGEYENKEIFELIEKEIEDDDLCLEIHIGVISNDFDLKDDKKIAQQLKRDITEIRAAKKRYKRKIDKLINDEKIKYNKLQTK